MTTYSSSILLSLLLSISTTALNIHAFQMSPMLPIIDAIPKEEIRQRLGIKQSDEITLINEHEVFCPISGSHQGILCTAVLPQPIESENAESIANNHELVSQVNMAGSLAASIRERTNGNNSKYYLPFVITLVESFMADEMENIDLGKIVFNSGGLETNEILMDLSYDLLGEEGKTCVMMFACNTQVDQFSATSDVYLFPPEYRGKCGELSKKVWRFSVDYKVASINLQQIPSWNGELLPDVWLKDDCCY